MFDLSPAFYLVSF